MTVPASARFGRWKAPVNVAPSGSTISSPPTAASSAACSAASSFAATRMLRVGDGYETSTVACGSCGATNDGMVPGVVGSVTLGGTTVGVLTSGGLAIGVELVGKPADVTAGGTTGATGEMGTTAGASVTGGVSTAEVGSPPADAGATSVGATIVITTAPVPISVRTATVAVPTPTPRVTPRGSTATTEVSDER